MSTGIFPQNGVNKNNAHNTVTNPLVEDDCDPKYYAPRCNPRFDPDAMNGVISEILNLMKCAGIPYDCGDLDNMCKAVEHHGIRGVQQFSLPSGTPFAIPNGTHVIDNGNFTIPNTYHQDIHGIMIVDFDLQFNQLVPGADTGVQLTFEMSVDPTYADAHTLLYQRIENLDTVNGRAQLVLNLTRAFTPKIEAGTGRKYYWRLTSIAEMAGAWTMQYAQQYATATFFGMNCMTFDTFGTD